MNVERSLRITLAVLSCMGTLMLAAGEENAGLAAAAIIVGVVAYVACDVFGFALTGFWSNLATIGVLILAAFQSTTMSPEVRILAMADLMAYLQFVLLLRARTARNLWLIALVSFLQVAVASALNTGLSFAIALLIYLFAGVLFLGQFFLFRERRKFEESAEAARLALSERRSGFVGVAHDEAEGRVASREFSRRMTGMVFGTIALAAFFFVAVPRLGQSTWVANQFVGGRTVGFSQEINLKGTGALVQDPDVVMRVHFKYRDTGLPFNPVGELYMRGTAVSRYESGTWRRPQSVMPVREGPPPETFLATGKGLIEQHVTVEPLATPTVFTCQPLFRPKKTADRHEEPSDLLYSWRWGHLSRPERTKAQRYSYMVLTPAFLDDKQAQIIPIVDDSVSTSPGAGVAYEPRSDLLQPFAGGATVPALAGLQAVARDVVKDIPITDVYQRAKALEEFLRDSGRFSYSLTPETRPTGVDPLEDFVVNRRRGHCEFFAGALTLMLRSVGIHSRIVLGYRGGEWNAVGNFYQFRQLHAHSWVEVYLRPDQIPPSKPATPDLEPFAAKNGAWLQLDGTTSGTTSDYAATSSTWYQLRQTLDYLQFLWNNYVLGMDALRQRDEVYKPLVSGLASTIERETDSKTWRERFSRLFESVVPESLRAGGFAAFASIAGAVVLVALAVFRLVRFRYRRRRSSTAAEKGRRLAAAPTVDFYLRLEAVLARHRLTRPSDQTQREFIQAACGELAELPETRSVAVLPRKIVEAFYQVRFGKRALDGAQRQEIEQALETLDKVLTPANPS